MVGYILIAILFFIFGAAVGVVLNDNKPAKLAPHVGELHVIVDQAYPDPQLYLQLDIDTKRLISYDRREVQVTVHTNATNTNASMN